MSFHPGDSVPDFTAQATSNQQLVLSEMKGKKIVLYFYPKDSTPGCTIQACSFRDGIDDLKKAGYVVLGVSKDSIKSHKNFITKQNLNFVLLSDPDKKVIESYKAFKEKSMFGKSYLGVRRTTYVIEKGIITKVIADSKPSDAVTEILGN